MDNVFVSGKLVIALQNDLLSATDGVQNEEAPVIVRKKKKKRVRSKSSARKLDALKYGLC